MGHWVPYFEKTDDKLQGDWNSCKGELPVEDFLLGPSFMKDMNLDFNPLLSQAIRGMIQTFNYSLDELLICEIEEVRKSAKLFKQIEERRQNGNYNF